MHMPIGTGTSLPTGGQNYTLEKRGDCSPWNGAKRTGKRLLTRGLRMALRVR